MRHRRLAAGKITGHRLSSQEAASIGDEDIQWGLRLGNRSATSRPYLDQLLLQQMPQNTARRETPILDMAYGYWNDPTRRCIKTHGLIRPELR